jgi:SpoIID/LytB domain protein
MFKLPVLILCVLLMFATPAECNRLPGSITEIPESVLVRLFSIDNSEKFTFLSHSGEMQIATSAGSYSGKQLVVEKPLSGNTVRVRVGKSELSSDSPVHITSVYPVTIRAGNNREKIILPPVTIRNTGERLLLIQKISFTNYILGVVHGEMPTGHDEALKAQAVAASSYALYNLNRHSREGYDFCDSTHCQFYRGMISRDTPHYSAVMSVRGELISKNGLIVESFYHSTCGGMTTNARDVFGIHSPGITGISDRKTVNSPPFCFSSPHFEWKYIIEKERLGNILKKERLFADIGTLQSLNILETDKSGRVIEIQVKGKQAVKTLSGYDFWQIMGYNLGWGTIKSSRFKVFEKNGKLTFSGLGLGHGLGKCQHGAMEMAKRGKSYKEILKHYFPDTELIRVFVR